MKKLRFVDGRHSRRRGAVAVLVAVSMVTLLAFAALTVDLGLMYGTRSDLQRTADAAAMAGAIRLMDQDRLKGGTDLTDVIDASRLSVSTFAALNPIYRTTPTVLSADIQAGYLSDPYNPYESLDTTTPGRFNAIQVVTRKDGSCNGPLDLLFAWIMGHQSTNVTATATAAFMDGVVGFRVDDGDPNAGLLPLALRNTSWLNLLNGTATSGDNYTYDPETGTVSPGPDGIPELNLYPGSGAGQLPPGNFGTVDIGSSGNSTADLVRQILYGVNAADLAHHGGELRLGDDGTLLLNGDTGLSAGIKDELEAIKGKARTIPIFSTVAGPGNNAMFTVVGFAGIRIMNVKLTGSMSSKNVIIQPAITVDETALVEASTGASYFVYVPVRLVR
jgi:Flp pilus assembly protein TadG